MDLCIISVEWRGEQRRVEERRGEERILVNNELKRKQRKENKKESVLDGRKTLMSPIYPVRI